MWAGRRSRLGTVALALVWLVSGTLYLLLPPSPDNFDHSYVAWRVLNGARPYVDLIEVNWPGTLALHALALSLFGVHEWSWRALDFLLAGLSLWCLADLMRQAGGTRVGRSVLWLGPVLYVTAGYWIAGQKDMSAAQFAIVALWCHVRACATSKARYQVGTGLAMAMALLNKPHIGLLILLLPLQALWCRTSWVWFRRYCLTSAAALLGALAATAMVLGWLGATWQAFWESGFVFATQNSTYEADLTTTTLAIILRPGAVRFWHLAILLCIPIAVMLSRRCDDRLALSGLMLVWFTGLVSVVAQRTGHPYHYAPSILVSIGMFSAGVAMCFEAVASKDYRSVRVRRWAFTILGATMLAALPWRLYLSYGRLPQALAGRGLDWHLAAYPGEAGKVLTMADVHAVVRRLRSDREDGCLYYVGESSAINLLLSRPAPTRFYYLPMLQRAALPPPIAHQWNDWYEQDLASANCSVVFVSRARHREWLDGPSPAAGTLRRFLGEYRLTERIGRGSGVDVYVRGAQQNGASD